MLTDCRLLECVAAAIVSDGRLSVALYVPLVVAWVKPESVYLLLHDYVDTWPASCTTSTRIATLLTTLIALRVVSCDEVHYCNAT